MQKIRNATAVSSANFKSCFETAKILVNFDRKLLEEKGSEKYMFLTKKISLEFKGVCDFEYEKKTANK